MSSKNITLRVNLELYEKYKQYCKKNGLVVSRQLEIMMEERIKGGNKNE